MKKTFAFVLLCATVAAAAQDENAGNNPVVMNNQADSLSYFLGLSLGYDLQTLPFDVNADLIIEGLGSTFDGTAPYDQQTTQVYFGQLQADLQQKEEENEAIVAEENLVKGAQFLEEIAAREGVVTTASGLSYEVLVLGDGPTPADTSQVTVHYEGTLMDGTVFDSSYDRGEPVTFPLDRVIAGCTEGVQLMPVGSTYRLYLPPHLGYGSRASGPIPANSVMIFKIELLGIDQ
jgi:FKBP-type peptidyl-prolyl cis-trans isomerase FkpA